MKMLDYLDEQIERERLKSGDYPSILELSQESIDKAKLELAKETGTDGCWTDKFPETYRGIKIKLI
jgi:hypothetical protein